MVSSVSDDIAAFRRLFVPPVSRHGVHEQTGWRTLHRGVSDADLLAHLSGGTVVGVSPAYQQGATWLAAFVALEADIATSDDLRDPELARAVVLGPQGHRCWEAVRAASEDLGIPGAHWTGAFSGRRSLHLLLLPEQPLPLATAHAIAQAIAQGARARGTDVCTACPTRADATGKVFRLPWGRHPFGTVGPFVDLGLFELAPRPPYPDDVHALAIIAGRRVPADTMQAAGAIALRGSVATKTATTRRRRQARRDAEQQASPDIARITRPCIAAIVRHGVPENHRHNIALLVRAELRHVGFTLNEAEPVVLQFAGACAPPWEPSDALYDLHQNWAVTDARKRHVCPGRLSESSLTGYLHKRACVGAQECAGHRAGPFMETWGARLSPPASRVYWALCALEVGYALRPGDGIHTTVAEVAGKASVGLDAFKRARAELETEGLVSHKRQGQGRGGGVHSIYQRTIPMPLPGAPRPEQVAREQSARAPGDGGTLR